MKDPRSPATERSRFRSSGRLEAPEIDLQRPFKDRDGMMPCSENCSAVRRRQTASRRMKPIEGWRIYTSSIR